MNFVDSNCIYPVLMKSIPDTHTNNFVDLAALI